MVGRDGRSLGHVFAEESLGRGAFGDEAVRPAETSGEDRLDGFRAKVLRHGVVD
jgi:hypothetical protein